jgi:hypothetical protein
MHGSLTAPQQLLEILQSRIGQYFDKSRSLTDIWNYKVCSSENVELEMRGPHASDELLYHRVLLEYSYPWLQNHAALVSPSSMDDKWPGPRQNDTLRHSSTAIWLLAATNAALNLTIEPETASYDLIFANIKELGGAQEYRYSGRLRTDLEYFKVLRSSQRNASSSG